MSKTEAITPIRRGFAIFVLATIAIYVVVLPTLHFLRSDVDPLSQLTGAYLSGPYGFVWRFTLLVFGIGQVAFVLGLSKVVNRSTSSVIGLILLSLWAVGVFIAALPALDQPDQPATLLDTIARLNGPLHILSLAVGALLISWNLRQSELWRSLHRAGLGLSLIMIILFLATAATLTANVGIAGLLQRVFVLAAMLWITLVALHLLRIMPKYSHHDEFDGVNKVQE